MERRQGVGFGRLSTVTVDIPSGRTHLGCVVQDFECISDGSEEIPGERTAASDFEELLSVNGCEHLFRFSLHDDVPLSGSVVYVRSSLFSRPPGPFGPQIVEVCAGKDEAQDEQHLLESEVRLSGVPEIVEGDDGHTCQTTPQGSQQPASCTQSGSGSHQETDCPCSRPSLKASTCPPQSL